MEARNRTLKEWYGMVERGQIKLPRFQRYEAWDRHRIASLMETVINNLPLGITLVLQVGVGNEKFVSRKLSTAPDGVGPVLEHLLDGQQRLTSLWRIFHNNYENESFFVYLEDFDNYDSDYEKEDCTAHFCARYIKNTGQRYPLWCDSSRRCLQRGYIPTHLLRPVDIQPEIEEWIDEATRHLKPETDVKKLEEFLEWKKSISDRIMGLRGVIANYNLPFLSLPPETEKTIALDVFIKMNTNSKPLSQYDIIVAEIESAMGRSLHDLQEDLNARHTRISAYSDLSDLILSTSALLQGEPPNQTGAWKMDKPLMLDNWAAMERGLSKMAEFLLGEGIYDKERLPTNAVLAVIAALYKDIPDSGDKRGKDEQLLRRYLWTAFFTDRYENSAATHANADFKALKRVINEKKPPSGDAFTPLDAPIFSEHRIAEAEELVSVDWPKRSTIRGRAILAVCNRLGALDFSTGEKLDHDSIHRRHYHHFYPDALLKKSEIDSYKALNCALIADKTNISIGRKDPLVYLSERYQWVTEGIVKERLDSHLIPIEELANGGYENMGDEEKTVKLAKDFDTFLRKRAELVLRAASILIEGRQLSVSEIFS